MEAIVLHNAGVPQPKSILELSEAEWDRTIAINLKSSFNWTRAAAPHMLQARWGPIITISSMTAKHGGGTGAGAISKVCYSAIKAGLLGLTRGLAKELALMITANAICPGLIEAPMTASLPLVITPPASWIRSRVAGSVGLKTLPKLQSSSPHHGPTTSRVKSSTSTVESISTKKLQRVKTAASEIRADLATAATLMPVSRSAPLLRPCSGVDIDQFVVRRFELVNDGRMPKPIGIKSRGGFINLDNSRIVELAKRDC
jgi:NAD(P)-dependent dehydrogenase (short-subunit alcohol dehydrogenase family)